MGLVRVYSGVQTTAKAGGNSRTTRTPTTAKPFYHYECPHEGHYSPTRYHSPSQQSVVALNPVAAEIAWNFAQLSLPQISPGAQPALSHESQSAQQIKGCRYASVLGTTATTSRVAAAMCTSRAAAACVATAQASTPTAPLSNARGHTNRHRPVHTSPHCTDRV